MKASNTNIPTVEGEGRSLQNNATHTVGIQPIQFILDRVERSDLLIATSEGANGKASFMDRQEGVVEYAIDLELKLIKSCLPEQ